MKFEYKVDMCCGTNIYREKFLNRLGKDGWELVSVESCGNRTPVYTFKRPIQDAKPNP